MDADHHDLVVISLEDWDEVWRRNQYFVHHLVRDDPLLRVLFVEPAVDAWRERRRDALVPRMRVVAPRVWALRPVKPLPRIVGPWSDLALRRQVRGASRRLAQVHPVLWINDLSYAGLVSTTGWPSVYDITDDWVAEESVPRRVRARRRVLEAQLMRECAEVVVCSPDLERSHDEERAVHLVPNGVDGELMTDPQPRPADLAPGPVAVYVGTLHEERLDVALVVELSRALPDLRIVLVGPNALGEAARTQLAAARNIDLLGPRPAARVPGYLQHADVVVVPHRVNRFTESLDPIKAYECLAVGVPTVATPVAGFRHLTAPVRVAPRETFAATVRGVLDDPPSREPALPPDATWESRSQQFGRILDAARPGGSARTA